MDPNDKMNFSLIAFYEVVCEYRWQFQVELLCSDRKRAVCFSFRWFRRFFDAFFAALLSCWQPAMKWMEEHIYKNVVIQWRRMRSLRYFLVLRSMYLFRYRYCSSVYYCYWSFDLESFSSFFFFYRRLCSSKVYFRVEPKKKEPTTIWEGFLWVDETESGRHFSLIKRQPLRDLRQ